MKTNWQYALLALLLAMGFWYVVTGKGKIETWVDVRLELKGMPQEYILKNSPPNKIEVRLRGPEGLVRTLPKRDIYHIVKVEHLKEGTNLIPINSDELPFASIFDIVEITPSTILLDVDLINSKSVPLEPEFNTDLPQGLKLTGVNFKPKEVTISGANSILNEIKSVQANIELPDDIQKNEFTCKATVFIPENIEVNPKTLTADVSISGSKKIITLSSDINIIGYLEKNEFIEPNKTQVTIETPLSWSFNENKNNVIAEVIINNKNTALPISIKLPVGIKLIKTVPSKVRIKNN